MFGPQYPYPITPMRIIELLVNCQRTFAPGSAKNSNAGLLAFGSLGGCLPFTCFLSRIEAPLERAAAVARRVFPRAFGRRAGKRQDAGLVSTLTRQNCTGCL